MKPKIIAMTHLGTQQKLQNLKLRGLLLVREFDVDDALHRNAYTLVEHNTVVARGYDT
jgi:hypothetical protein